MDDELVVGIRWMLRRDLPAVVAIEEASFERPWDAEEFSCCLRQKNTIGMVAEHDGAVMGFMIYELHSTRLHLIALAVDPLYRRKFIGLLLVQQLVNKLGGRGRNRITLEVRETNLDAQLFFKALGFKAKGVLKGFYEDSDEDAYQMQFRHLVDDTGVLVR